MNKNQLIDHLRAYAETYELDAEFWRERKRPDQALFVQGKAEAFATAAAWLEEMEG